MEYLAGWNQGGVCWSDGGAGEDRVVGMDGDRVVGMDVEATVGWRFHKDGSGLPSGKEWVFVFGSNLDGIHGKGAAKAAWRDYGAVRGQGIGMQGRSYAIPTKGKKIVRPGGRIDFEVLALSVVWKHVQVFLDEARARPELMFMVTRIGCGEAGHANQTMAPMFANAPQNCSFAEEWRSYLCKPHEGRMAE